MHIWIQQSILNCWAGGCHGGRVHLPIKIALRPVTVALGAAPFGLLQCRAGSPSALAMLDDFAISMHLTNAAALAAGRPLGPVADATVATPLRRRQRSATSWWARARARARAPARDGGWSWGCGTGSGSGRACGLCRVARYVVIGRIGAPVTAGNALHQRMLIILGHHIDHTAWLLAVVVAVGAKQKWKIKLINFIEKKEHINAILSIELLTLYNFFKYIIYKINFYINKYNTKRIHVFY